jgi:hypothetical protein
MAKKIVALLAITMTLIATPSQAEASPNQYDLGGVGYQNSWTLPSLTPFIALGTVAVVAIAVLAIRHHHHSHH